MSVYRRTLVYFKPFLGETALAMLLTLVSIGLNLLKPVPIRLIFDHVLLSPDAGRKFLAVHGLGPASAGTIVLCLCGALVLIQLLGGIIGLFTSLLFVKVGLQALLDLRTELYSYLQSLPLKYHDARRSSDSSFRVAYDSQAIQTIYNKGFSNIFNSTLTLAFTFFFMWRMDWLLTLLSMGIVPLIVAAIYFYANRIRTESTTIQERESAVLAAAQEGLSSIRMVHAFGREEFEVTQFNRHARESLEANLKLTMTSVSSALVVGTLMAVGTAVMYYVGSLHVLSKVLTIGALYQFAAYLLMLYQPLESLTYTVWALEGAAAGAQRCFEVLDKVDEVKDAPNAKRLGVAKGAVSFENVAFGYEPGRLILRDISLDILAGQTVAFVGGTGAGKSTLLSLVPQVLRSHRGPGAHGWRRPARAHEKIAPRPDQHRAPGHRPLLHHHPREHRLRTARRQRGGDHRSGPARPGAYLHHGHAGEIPQPGRRAREPPQRRAAPAHRHRARLSEERARSAAGRTDFGARPHHRTCHHGNHEGFDGGANHPHYHPPHRHRA